MREVVPHSIELIGGYVDPKSDPKAKVTHRRVTFGKHIDGQTLFNIDSDPQSAISTQYQALLLRSMITEFGTLKMPVDLRVLLALDQVDWDDLMAASEVFGAGRGSCREKTEDELEPQTPTFQILSESTVRLAFGYERNGLVYDLAEFGTRPTVMDSVEADKLQLLGIRRNCFLAGKQVKRLYQSNGASELSGPVGLEIFERLDAVDIRALTAASEVWRESFRTPRR